MAEPRVSQDDINARSVQELVEKGIDPADWPDSLIANIGIPTTGTKPENNSGAAVPSTAPQSALLGVFDKIDSGEYTKPSQLTGFARSPALAYLYSPEKRASIREKHANPSALERGLGYGSRNQDISGLSDFLEASSHLVGTAIQDGVSRAIGQTAGRMLDPGGVLGLKDNLGEITRRLPDMLPPVLQAENQKPNAALGYLSDRAHDLSKMSPERFAPRAVPFKQISTLDEVGTWLGEQLGAAAASSLVPATGGIVGGVTGLAIGGTPGAVVGAGVGAFTGSMILNYGEVYRALVDAGLSEQEAAQMGLKYGTAMAALDTLSTGLIFRSLTKPVRQAGIAKLAQYVAKKSAQGAPGEGLTETVQEGLKEVAVATNTDKAFDPMALVEAGIIGTLFGAAAGGGGSIIGNAVNPVGEKTLEITKEQLEALRSLQDSLATDSAPEGGDGGGRSGIQWDENGVPYYADDGAGSVGPDFAERPEGFYSAAERAVESAPQDTMPRGQWINWLKKQPGVKPEEIELLKLEETLPQSDKPLSRSQVVEALREAGTPIKIYDTLDGAHAAAYDANVKRLIAEKFGPEGAAEYEANRQVLSETGDELHQYEADHNNRVTMLNNIVNRSQRDHLGLVLAPPNATRPPGVSLAAQEVAGDIAVLARTRLTANTITNASLTEGTLVDRMSKLEAETGEFSRQEVDNVRWFLKKRDEFKATRRKNKEAYSAIERAEFVAGVLDLQPVLSPEWGHIVLGGPNGVHDYAEVFITAPELETYTHPHFPDVKNIIAHARYTIRDDGSTFFVEEIQSDLHQTGRKHGYRLPPKEAAAELKALREELVKLEAAQEKTFARVEKAVEKRQRGLGKSDEQIKKENLAYGISNVVNDANKVYYNNTSEARDRAIKGLREGFGDEIIDASLEYNKVRKAQTTTQLRLNQRRFAGDDSVPNYPFKKAWPEMAFKVMLQKAVLSGAKRLTLPAGDTAVEIEGTDVVYDFYEENLPRIVNGYLKKMGLPPLERAEFKLGIGDRTGSFDVWSIPITPLVREKIIDGQVLFATKSAGVKTAVKSLSATLGSSMYDEPIAQVTVKELLQNAFDGIKSAQKIGNLKGGKAGTINIALNRDERSIVVADNGHGLTEEMFIDGFLSIGGSIKQGLTPQEASGGFGLAKMAFMFGNKTIELNTVQDGTEITFKSTGKELLDSDGTLLPYDIKSTNKANGTSVKITLPESYIDQNHEEQNIVFDHYTYAYAILQKPLIGNMNVNVFEGGMADRYDIDIRNWEVDHLAGLDDYQRDNVKHPEKLGVLLDLSSYTTRTEIKLPWGDIDVYIDPNKVNDNPYRNAFQSVLSNGIWQFDADLKQAIPNEYTKIPLNIIFDVHPNGTPQQPGYPFNTKRESFNKKSLENLEPMYDLVRALYIASAMKDTVASFSSNVLVYDLQGNLIEDLGVKVREAQSDILSQEFGIEVPAEITIKNGRITDRRTGDKVFESSELQRLVDTIGTATELNVGIDSEDRLLINHGLYSPQGESVDIFAEVPGSKEFIFALGNIYRDFANGIFSNDLTIGDFRLGLNIAPEGQLGVTTYAPFRSVLINPLGRADLMPDIEGLAADYIATMLHELTHINNQAHNTAFSYSNAGLFADASRGGLLRRTTDKLESLVRNNLIVITEIRNLVNDTTRVDPSSDKVLEGSKNSQGPSGVDRDSDGYPSTSVGQRGGRANGRRNRFPQKETSRGDTARGVILANLPRKDVTPAQDQNWKDSYTPEQQARLEDSLRKIITHLIGTRGAPKVTFGDMESVRQGAIAVGGNPGAIRGFYHPGSGISNTQGALDAVLQVAITGQPLTDVFSTTFHEAWHHAQRFLLDKKEKKLWDIQHKKAVRLALKHEPSFTDITNKIEVQARVIELWSRDLNYRNRMPNEYRTFLERIMAFLERLQNWVRGAGFRNINDSGAAFFAGDMANRLNPGLTQIEDASVWTSMSPAAFKNWFRKTVVRWQDGLPRTVYHGSRSNFDEWKYTSDIGFHFAGTPAAANQIALGTGRPEDIQERINENGGAVVYPVFIRAENPYRTHDMGLWHPSGLALDMFDRGIISQARHSAYTDLLDGFESIAKDKAKHKRAYKMIREDLRKAGYDSIVYENVGEKEAGREAEDAYIVFEPQQIKSVFNQHPSEDPRIQYSLRIGKKAMRELEKATDVLRSTHSISLWHRAINTPRHIASRFAEFANIFNIGHAKHNYRMLFMSDAVHDIINDVKRFGSLQDANDTELKNITDMFVLADSKQEHPKVRQSDGKLVLDHIVLTENEKNMYIEARAGFVYTIDQFEDSYRIHHKEFFDKYGIPLGTSRESLKNLHSTIAAMFKNDPTNNKLSALEDGLKDITGWLTEMHNLRTRPYMPHMRFGDKGVAAWGKDAKGNEEIIHLEAVETKGVTNRYGWQDRVRKIEERLRAQYPNARVGSFNLTNDIRRNIHQDKNIMSQLDVLAEALNNNDLASYKKMRPVLDQEARKIGFKAHLTHRKNIPGYSTDLRRVIGSYLLGASNMSASLRYGKQLNDAVSAMTGDTAIIEYANEYVKYISSPVEEYGTWRMLGFLYYLGGNASSAFLQLLTLPEFTGPTIGMVAGNATAVKELARATNDVAQIWALSGYELTKGNKPADRSLIFNPKLFQRVLKDPVLVKALLKAFADGDIRPILTPQQMGVDPAKAQSKFLEKSRIKAAVNALPAMFNMSEVAARMTAYIAAHRAYHSNPTAVAAKLDEVYSKDEVWKNTPNNSHEFARFVIDSTFGMYGKGNRAWFMRGKGAAVFQFTSYPLQMLELMVRTATRQGPAGRKAAGLMLLALFFFGGWQGLPLLENIKDMLEWLWSKGSGVDFDTDQVIRDFMNEITGTPWVGEVINRGFVRTMGMDISRRASLGTLPALDIIGSLIGGRASADSLGVPASLTLGNTKSAYEHWKNTGSVGGAALEVLPPFLRNIVQAFTWNNSGVRTMRGDLVVPKEEITEWDTFLKTLGFNPAKVAQAREERFATRRVSTAVQGLQGRYTRRIVGALVKLREANREGRADAAEKHRETIRGIYNSIKEHNAAAPLHEKIIMTPEAIRKALTQAEGNTTYGAPRKSIRRIKEIEESR